MIEERAIVVALEGEFAWVETDKERACGQCASHGGCSSLTLAKFFSNRARRVRAVNRIGAATGDQVVVGIDESALVRGSLAVYAVPLLALIAGALVGEAAATALTLNSELAATGGGIAGLAGGLLWLRHFSGRARTDARYQPVLLRRTGGRSAVVGVLAP